MPGPARVPDGPKPLGSPPAIGDPIPFRMYALTVHRDRYGPPAESLRFETVPVPRLRPGDSKRVLVEILATGPNFNTNFAALGLPVPVFGRGDSETVHVPGSDALGLVVDAGPAVKGLKTGQAVILDSWTGRNIRGYETHDGFNAQYALVDEDRAIPLPAPLRRRSPERLAALLLACGTAYRAVVERLRVSPGDSVLVMGGGKGTSFWGAQIAKMLGARVILAGSDPRLAESLIRRGIADAFVDRRTIPAEAFGAIPPGIDHAEWTARTEPFRRAVFGANGGRPFDKVFEHTGGRNFPLLVSALGRNGALVFFGATGGGLKGEYRETFFYDGRRFVMDARWVWMRQKQVLFRTGSPESIFDEIGLLPGRRGMVWGADDYARRFVGAALARGCDVAVVASSAGEKAGIARLRRMGVPASSILDRDAFRLPEDMPDPLTEGGTANPEYAAVFLKSAQALGKALWGVFGPRVSPDFVVERTDQSTLHFSTFVARDFDERDAMPCGFVLARGKANLSIRGSHMYGAAQAGEVVRLLGSGRIAMEQDDLDVVPLGELPAVQQKMLDGTLRKPKGVALVQADRAGRPVSDYEDAYLGEKVRTADPAKDRFLEIRLRDDVAILTISRPDALNALSEALLSQLSDAVRELSTLGSLEGRTVKALVLTGAGRSFVAGADVKEFLGKPAATIAALAAKNIAVFSALESLSIPVVAVVDGFALGGGNELAMSAHYRVVTENAALGQPEVKLGIIPGYGGMQRLPRLVGPAKAAGMCVNGEPLDGHAAVEWGLAHEFCASATALSRAVLLARDFASGKATLPRRDWDSAAAAQIAELRALVERPAVRDLLSAPTPAGAAAGDLRAARRAAGRTAISAMVFGYENGFAAGLRNDAAAFGEVTASPAGQEWVGRFLAKDPVQSSFLTLLPPPDPAGETESAPISKKAPGDRQLSADEVARIASLIAEKAAEGKVAGLPPSTLKEALSVMRARPVPALLARLAPGTADGIPRKIARALEKGEIGVSVVDLGDATGFPRENARPACEVMLVRFGEELRWAGKRNLLGEPGASPCIYLTAAFAAKARSRPHLLLQALLHPMIEWVFGMPHMVAVLCESAYDAAPAGDGATGVSDLNRFIAEEAGRERDVAYFDRVLGTSYEPDEFRMEELAAAFGEDEAKTGDVVEAARAMGGRFRAVMEEVLARMRGEIVREHLASARKALDEGETDAALTILRKIQASPETPPAERDEAAALTGLAIRAYALDADPAYEGLRMAKGELSIEPWAGRKARSFAELLGEAIATVRRHGEPAVRRNGAEVATDPLAEGGSERTIHVITDLERPSAKFIDGHDRVHWVFEKTFAESLLSARSAGHSPRGIAAAMACRFVRDGAFPDEKLKLEKQYAVAVKGAVEGYRFYQALPAEERAEMAAFYESSGVSDPLYRLFVSLGEETHPARAGHLIRRAVGRTHSYNYVRYPDTSLAGQVIVVTGGGTGMGRAIALEAAIRGANVVVTGRRPAPLEETAADMNDLIRHLGLTNQTLVVQGDLSDPKYVGEMFERIEREFGRIDVLYNNAGVSGPVEFGSAYEEEHFEQYREAVAIHLTGAWLASIEAARVMESQAGGGVIAMVGTFYSESIHRHVLHAYPGRLPYTSAQSAKLALGDYLAWMLSGKNITAVSLNPSAVSTDRIRRGSGVFDKGSRARARIGRNVSPDALEKDTLDRTVGHEFVFPRDFARVALDVRRVEYRRSVGGQRIPMGGVTYEQPPGLLPSPAALTRYPDLVGKVALVTVHRPLGGDLALIETAVKALARSGANVVMAGSRPGDLDAIALRINAGGGEGMATVHHANLSNFAEVQALFDGLPRVDLLLHFTGSVDWKRPLMNLPYEEWCASVDRFGFVPRLLCWQAERRMDRDGVDGTIAIVGPDLSGVPSIRERNLVQVFQAMLRPAVATEAMERALMRKAQADGSAPAHVSAVNIGLVLPGRVDGRNKQASAGKTAASVLWLLGDGKPVSGAVLLPDEQNSLARLPEEPVPASGSTAGKVVVVTGGIRNLGREISLRFGAEKATVVVASRRPRPDAAPPEEADKAKTELAAGDAVLSKMRALGGRSLWVDTDVSRPQRVRALIEETRNRFGGVDVFVNNAGAGGEFSLVGDVLREHRPSWDSVLRSNFLGPWAAACALREIMRKQPDGGTIVNVSTHYADHPYLFRTIYTVSKILLKSLTSALGTSLSADNIRIADVAPSLIAGPRMDWVMRNYAGKFAGQFDTIPELRAAERSALQELFVRSFDRALPAGDRRAAAAAFLASLAESRLPKARRGGMESWYGRISEWFECTVPGDPPTNEQVADAVLFAAKNARFLEDRFVGVSTLPPFRSFPGEENPPQRAIDGDSLALVAFGSIGGPASALGTALEAELIRTGATVTSLFESTPGSGRVDVSRPAPAPGRGGARRRPERTARELDLSEPKVLEPWLDNALLGGPPPAGAVVLAGTSAEGKPFLGFSAGEMEGFLAHVGKALNVFAESARAVRERGNIVVVAPPGDTEEGQVIRAGLRQIVRTYQAEQHFLPSVKKLRLSLVGAPRDGEEREFVRRILDILSCRSAPAVEPVPVGRPRP